MKSNDEVMILIKIREQKEEIARLKDKVEWLQDRIDKAINWMEEEQIFMPQYEEIENILKGSDNNE